MNDKETIITTMPRPEKPEMKHLKQLMVHPASLLMKT